MRLKLVLSLATVLAFSCQQNTSKVQDSSSDNVEVLNSLSQEEQKAEMKKLSMMVEKVFVKESDNKLRSKMIYRFFLKSKLSEKEKTKILKEAMINLDLSTEDRKEISLHLTRLKRMELKK
ncbi:MAG: hypothetical protein CND86_04575 [Bacteroidetes bacterium MED-G21]|nr:MAG: hypothetical protein CND86_04575 [Bacteroidetes bacterium MED-G21]|tara:strand:+ start:668 stop:1030 length:363 start_codon:yes stop_codon:yes gene_type:complete